MDKKKKNGCALNKLKLNLVKDALSKLKDIASFRVQPFQENPDDTGYFVEAEVFPSDRAYEKIDGTRGDVASDVAVYFLLQDEIARKCRFIPHRSKVRRVIISGEGIQA